jgi:hypothetical protein
LNSDLLFPRTPVEVVEEIDGTHVYVEGQWCARFHKPVRVCEPSGFVERSIQELVAHEVEDIVARSGDDWLSPPLRIVPDWPKWKEISQIDVIEAQAEAQRLKRGRTRRTKNA